MTGPAAGGTTVRGIILFAHGSRDPLWRLPLEAVAERIRRREPHATVLCAYLELCEPSLPAAADRMVAAGVGHLRIFPIFFGVGKHAREDLPLLVADLKARHAGLAVELLPAAGEHDELMDLMASIALG